MEQRVENRSLWNVQRVNDACYSHPQHLFLIEDDSGNFIGHDELAS